MPKYQITVPDGRQVVVDATNPQDAAEAAGTWANQGKSPAEIKAAADAQPIKPGAGGLMRSMVNGLTFNAAPEFNGAINAGMTGIRNFVAHATGQPDAGYNMGDAFKAAETVERNAGQRFSADHPILNIGGNLTGAMLNPANVIAGKFVAGAPTLAGTTLRSAATAAPIGAVYGAGAAGPGKRLRGAMTGGAAGAVMGAAAPPLLAGGKALLGAAGDMVGDLTSGARNLISPADPEGAVGLADTDVAMAKLSDLAKSKGIDIPMLSDPSGKGMTTAEAIGRPGISSLGALARRSGTTPDVLEAQLRTRAANAPARILDDFAAVSGIHPEEAAGNVDALSSRLEAEAEPLYTAVRSNPAPIWNTDLAKLSERPAIKKAIDAAGKSMLNAGQDPVAVGLKLDPDTGAFVLNQDLSNSTEAQPTAATWDKVKKMVSALVQRDPVTGRVIRTGEVGIQNGDYATAAKDLTTALAGDPAHGVQGAIPGYRAALDKAGDYLSMRDAFDRAQTMFLKPGVSAKDFASAYSSLSEPEQKAWLSGMASKLSDQMQAGRLTPRMLMQPHVQGKVAAVLGDGPAADFLGRLVQEAQLAGAGSRMMPGAGSPTMELLNAAGEQDSGGVPGMVAKALTRPKAVVADIWNASQSRLTSPQVRNELGRLLSQPPEATAAEFGGWTPPMRPAMMPPKLPYPAMAGVTGSAVATRRK
jgi:hypothetical protein